MKCVPALLVTFLWASVAYGSPWQKISNGQPVDSEAKYPYMAVVERDAVAICGAAVIADRWALTAGHCVDTTGFYTLFAGSYLIGDTTGTRVSILNALPHPEYGWGITTLPNDIAILQLEPLDLTGSNIASVAMPEFSANFDDQFCNVTGWGRTESSGGSEVIVLREAVQQVVPITTCQDSLGTDVVDELDNMCAVDPDSLNRVCRGDDGSPLVCGGQLAGLVSFYIGQCPDNQAVYQVYTRVANYREWIYNVTGV